jgi:tetratricopeptide (TPR) repeat protein
MLLRVMQEDGQAVDDAAVFDVTTNLAGLRFFLADYAVAEQLLAEARSLLPALNGKPQRRDVARIPWLEAHLYRWRGEPERALRPALAAAHEYDQSAGGSTVRIQVVVADVALDLAATMPPGTDRDALLTLAEPHITRATVVATEVGDDIGGLLARLTALRLMRMRGENRDRVAPIEEIARRARRLQDDALLAQAFTALGNEWSERKEHESAQVCYRQTLSILDGSDVPALGVWAKRELLRADRQM